MSGASSRAPTRRAMIAGALAAAFAPVEAMARGLDTITAAGVVRIAVYRDFEPCGRAPTAPSWGSTSTSAAPSPRP